MQGVYVVHEVKHAPAYRENLRHDILSIHLKPIFSFSSQGHVQHRPAFCGVQFDTSKQVRNGARQVRFFAQGDQRVFHLCIPPLLGRIDVQALQVPRQGLHTRGVLRKRIPHIHVPLLQGQGFQPLLRLRIGQPERPPRLPVCHAYLD